MKNKSAIIACLVLSCVAVLGVQERARFFSVFASHARMLSAVEEVQVSLSVVFEEQITDYPVNRNFQLRFTGGFVTASGVLLPRAITARRHGPNNRQSKPTIASYRIHPAAEGAIRFSRMNLN